MPDPEAYEPSNSPQTDFEKDRCESLQGISVATQHALRLSLPDRAGETIESSELSESPFKTPRIFADAPSLSPHSIAGLSRSDFGDGTLPAGKSGTAIVLLHDLLCNIPFSSSYKACCLLNSPNLLSQKWAGKLGASRRGVIQAPQI